MDEDEFTSELLTAESELGHLIDALAKASKEHDRFITISISIGPHDTEPQVDIEAEHS